MRNPGLLMLIATMLTLSACDSAQKLSQDASPPAAKTESTDAARQQRTLAPKSVLSGALMTTVGGRAKSEDPTLSQSAIVQASTLAADRKIIRNGDLTLETGSPTDGLRRITAVAESHGGFVVNSEFTQTPVEAGAKPSQTVTVIARVPASQFASALDEIRGAGERVISEKISGQDVSEEYLDLEARLRTKKALEAQFLEIMKQARKVQDALDVQSQLADVRTEIERLEGKRRFLENQAVLSTITTTLQMPQPLVAATTGRFGVSLKRTVGDAVDLAASIILFIIQAVIVIIPIGLFAGLPAWLIWRVLRRRVWVRRVEPSAVPHE